MMFPHAANEPILSLTDEQSWQLLENTQHGRLVVVVNGAADIFPVNYATQEGTLVFRTAPGSKLAQVAVNESVVFETDGILSDEAWSVVVRGTAERLETSTDVAKAEELDLRPWVPTLKDTFVRIVPNEISGRHFAFGPHPEREI